MVELDGYVGELLKKLDDLGVADNTIVVFTTDNGAEVCHWPDGGATPFRGEKDTNWEGGWRVPCVMRWPGVIKPGSHQRHLRARGLHPDLRGRGRRAGPRREGEEGLRVSGKTFKVHLDGYNLLPFLKGEAKESPREGFIYWSDDGDLMALRVSRLEGRVRRAAHNRSALGVWQGPFSSACSQVLRPARRPVRARRRKHQLRGLVQRARLLLVAAQTVVAKWLESFKEFPPRAKAASFTVSDAMEKITSAANPNK